ncbi:GAF domain-containing protein [Pontibacter sp. HSC-14F20]|uniref:GAF domain-containing protein n=1 Tax=Pontibacter sp. HSC-14F20 TaxID=2864136 RepID=UPI001C73369C|nr:GAF domain-containing protein [Pontibacter sp. HSC-14F20]MBX0331941.1 GAF domain-containing protein [Pontibacter sp. HSC-14F20]
MKNIPAALLNGGEKNYDSDFCGSIPLHQINLIQPHGLLLVLDKTLHIRQVSENSANLLGLNTETLLEQPLSAFVPENELADLQQKLTNEQEQVDIPFSLTFRTGESDIAFTATVHPEPEQILIEMEPAQREDDKSFLAFFQQIKYITSRIKQAENTEAIAQAVAAEFKRFTGFDRVLVYRFDAMWNGTVLGQAKTEDMSDLLGLRFPASDVPKQARDLYFKNPYRLIPARDYEPVRLHPILNPITRRFTDLTSCNLRSVAGVHLEYMGNMGISASMSVPLIMEGNLWGLISCHHKTPKYPSYQERTAMELLSAIAAVRLGAYEREQRAHMQAHLRGQHATMLEQLFNQEYFTEALLHGQPNLLELLSLDGAAILYEGEVHTVGKTPPVQKIKELASWLRRNSSDKTYVTNSLPQAYPNSKDYKDEASGLLALAINPDQGEFILCFRGEVLQTVNWSGNPDKAIRMEPDGKSYHPRNSFALYQQTVQLTSLPWQQEELEAAEALRSAVLSKIIREKY